MNYGYKDERDNNALFLESEDEFYRYFIQLYNFVVRGVDLQGKFANLFRSSVRDFAAVKDTRIYRMLETGQMQYLFYLLKKR